MLLHLEKRKTATNLAELQARKDIYTLYGKDVSDIEKQISEFNQKESENRIKSSEEEKQKRIANEKEIQQALEDLAFDSAQRVSDFAFNLSRDRKAAEFDEQLRGVNQSKDTALKALDEQHSQEVSRKGITDNQKKRLDEKYAKDKSALEIKTQKEESKIKTEAFKSQQKADVTQAEINGLIAVSKTFAQFGFTPAGFIAVAGIALQTALTVAAIKAKPVPAFKEGTEFLEGPGTGTSDHIHIRASRGERIVTAEKNKKFFPALSAIHNDDVSPEFANMVLAGVGEPWYEKPVIDNIQIGRDGLYIDENKIGRAVVEGMARVMNSQSFNDGDDSHSERTTLLRKLVDNTSRNSDPRRQ